MDVGKFIGEVVERKNAFDRQVSATAARGIPAVLNVRNSRHLQKGAPCFAVLIPGAGDTVAGQVIFQGTANFLSIYNTVLVARLVLTWFPSAPPAIVQPLSSICDPYLGAFRGLLPPLGGLDLSPILAFTVLNVFQTAATALPCDKQGKPRAAAPLGLPRLPVPWAKNAGEQKGKAAQQ